MLDDEANLLPIQRIVAETACLPRVSARFRREVLARAERIQERSELVQRVQTVATMLLGLLLICSLPGYYWLLRGADSGPQQPRLGAVPRAVQAVDASAGTSYEVNEWRMVESALAARNHAARIIARPL